MQENSGSDIERSETSLPVEGVRCKDLPLSNLQELQNSNTEFSSELFNSLAGLNEIKTLNNEGISTLANTEETTNADVLYVHYQESSFVIEQACKRTTELISQISALGVESFSAIDKLPALLGGAVEELALAHSTLPYVQQLWEAMQDASKRFEISQVQEAGFESLPELHLAQTKLYEATSRGIPAEIEDLKARGILSYFKIKAKEKELNATKDQRQILSGIEQAIHASRPKLEITPEEHLGTVQRLQREAYHASFSKLDDLFEVENPQDLLVVADEDMARVLGTDVWELLMNDESLCGEVKLLIASLPSYIKKESIAQAGVAKAEALRAVITLGAEEKMDNNAEIEGWAHSFNRPFYLLQKERAVINETSEKLLGLCMGKELLPELEGILAIGLVKNPDDIRAVNHVYKAIRHNISLSGKYDIQHAELYFRLAEKQEKVEHLMEVLSPYMSQFNLSAYNVDIVLEAAEHADYIGESLREISAYSPEDYYYALDKTYDPYENIFKSSWQASDKLKYFLEVKAGEGNELPERKFTDGLLRFLRNKDIPITEKHDFGNDTVKESEYEAFAHSMVQCVQERSVHPQEGAFAYNDIYLSDSAVIEFLGRQPTQSEQVIDLPNRAPVLFAQLFQPDGRLAARRQKILRNLFEDKDPISFAQEYEATLSTDRTPYWEQLLQSSMLRLRSLWEHSSSLYPITEVGGKSIAALVTQHQISRLEDVCAVTEFSEMIKGKAILEDLVQSGGVSVPFSALTLEYKKRVLGNYLQRTIESSRSNEMKKIATERNEAYTQRSQALILEHGDLVHAGAIDYLDSVLLNGNLPGECLGGDLVRDGDNTPGHVDFSGISAQEIESCDGSVEKILKGTLAAGFGCGGQGQIFYLYHRNDSQWERGKEGELFNNNLLFGGIPSTEIGGLVLSIPETSLATAINQTVVNGSYIPLYNLQGDLLFTPIDYEEELRKVQPYKSPGELIKDFFTNPPALEKLYDPTPGGIHQFPLIEHLSRVTSKAGELADSYGLEETDKELVLLAAAFHDIGKANSSQATDQDIDNPLAALPYLRKIRAMSYDRLQEVILLIGNDELFGNLIGGNRAERASQDLARLFPSERDKKMLLSLYQADVWELDGTGEQYRAWRVDEGLRRLGLNFAVSPR